VILGGICIRELNRAVYAALHSCAYPPEVSKGEIAVHRDPYFAGRYAIFVGIQYAYARTERFGPHPEDMGKGLIQVYVDCSKGEGVIETHFGDYQPGAEGFTHPLDFNSYQLIAVQLGENLSARIKELEAERRAKREARRKAGPKLVIIDHGFISATW